MGTRGVALVLLVTAGCGENPTSENIVGVWSNDDDDVARIIHFVAGGNYGMNVDDTPVQAGTYEVSDDVLVTVDGEERTMDDVIVWTVQSDASGAIAPGTQLGDPIYRLQGDEMDLRSTSADSGQRTWIRISAD